MRNKEHNAQANNILSTMDNTIDEIQHILRTGHDIFLRDLDESELKTYTAVLAQLEKLEARIERLKTV